MARVVTHLKRAPQSLAHRCFIMTGLNKLILVELNGGFICSSLTKGRSLVFGWMFSILFLRQRIHLLPICFIINLAFKIQYILLIFDRISSCPRRQWLWYFLTISVVICLASKTIWCFHSHGIFAHFSLPHTLIMLL